MRGTRGRTRITLGVTLLAPLVRAMAGALFLFVIPFGAPLVLGALDTPGMRTTVLEGWGTAAVGVSLVLWGLWVRRAAPSLPAPARRGPRQQPERTDRPRTLVHRSVAAADPGPPRRLTQAVEWSADGWATVYTIGLTPSDQTLLKDALQSGEMIEVPDAAGVSVARVAGRDVQQVWGGPNVPFYVLQRH